MKLLQFLMLLLPLAAFAGHNSDAESGEDMDRREGVKINWQPVWDSDPVAGDPKQVVSDESLYGLLTQKVEDSPKQSDEELGPCDAPNGYGLHNLLKQAQTLLPLERIKHIIRGASGDPEVRALLQLLRSAPYRERVQTLQRSKEYVGFELFACYKLNLDLKLYIHFVCGLIDLSASEVPAASGEAPFQGRPGIRGLLLDIRDVLPRQKLHDLYETLLRSDHFLARAISRIHTREFKMLLNDLRQNPDYMGLWQSLKEVGVPIQELRDLIDIALGWYHDELDKTDPLDTMI